MNKLNRKFFERNPVEVAKDILGCYFVHETKDGIIKGKIVETEAYGNANDLASHARFESSKRNEIMFGQAGILYVYHIYGIFYLTNIICEEKGKAGAVLLRAIEITEGQNIATKNLSSSKFVKIDDKFATGPGKLSLAFEIDKRYNHLDLTNKNSQIFIENKNYQPKIVESKRIGVDYADYCKDYLWRFYIEGSQFVSKK